MKKVIFILVPCLIVGLVGLGLYVRKFEYRKNTLEIFFFYLNRGRSVFIRTPQGKTILIDTGQNGEVMRELTKVFPFYRRTIDVAIVTSALPKNSGGLAEVLSRFDVEKIVVPILLGTSTARDAYEKVMKKKSIQPDEVQRGDVFEVDGVRFEVLFPEVEYKYNKSSVPELLLRIDYQDSTILLLGDSSKAVQNFVMRMVENADLVEFAHGATKSRVSADLLLKLELSIVVSTKREETLRFEF